MTSTSQPIPFRLGSPIRDPKYFIGRAVLVQKSISNALRRMQNIAIRGERRTGKTSTLLYVSHDTIASTLVPDNHILVYFDFQHVVGATITEIWQELGRAIVFKLKAKAQQQPELFQSELSQRFESTISQAFTIDDESRLFGTFFGRAFAELAREKINVHLLFDEFDLTRDDDQLGDNFYDTLRSLPTRSGNLSYVTATRIPLADLQSPSETKVSSPLANIFSNFVLTPFTDDEVFDLIIRYYDDAGIDLALAEKLYDLAPLIYDVTGYHPLLLQMFCYHITNFKDQTGWPFSDVIQQATLEAFRQDAEQHFTYYWEVSQEKERELMRDISERGRGNWKEAKDRSVVDELRNRCLLVAEYGPTGGWRLFSSLFTEWIRQQPSVIYSPPTVTRLNTTDLNLVPNTEEDAENVEAEVAEGQIFDYITYTLVADSPIERTVQSVAKGLVEQYGFDREQIARDQTLSYQVIDDGGKSRNLRKKIQLLVYPEGEKKLDPKKAIRVCLVQPPNTKASDLKRGVTQLEEVLTQLPDCWYGIWTNGTDMLYWRKLIDENQTYLNYEDLYDLPGFGETAADLDDPERHAGHIATGDNLQLTFRRIHNYIYGNQGLKKDVAFWQILNLIFCKIYDERDLGRRRFWIRSNERNTPQGQAIIAARIKHLFNEVKRQPEYESIFSENDQITLSDRVLAYVVGELSRYNLSKTDVDVKGTAYEEITANMLKAQRGQFFTPPNIIKLMIQMMDPASNVDLTNPYNWPRIIDPACGSGRFLTYALDHIRHKLADQLFPNEHPLLRSHRLEEDAKSRTIIQEYARKCLYGIDFDPDLKRAARMNMILNNDGYGNILSFNSLEFPSSLNREPLNEVLARYKSLAPAELPDTIRALLDGNLGSFDFVFTNPPFGTKIPIDDSTILHQYELGHRWWRNDDGRWVRSEQLQRRVAPEVLFVERCVRWVKPGTGRVAIVLPDGILGNPDAEYIRAWILANCQLLASVDLPVEAFLPQVGVQASLLFLRRKSLTEMEAEAWQDGEDSQIFMAIAEKVGHDRRGNTTYVCDADGAEMIFEEQKPVLRRRQGVLEPLILKVLDKKEDDDLPQIGSAYRDFLISGKLRP